MQIRDNYRIDNLGDRCFIYDFCNRFICSADTRRESEEDIDRLECKFIYSGVMPIFIYITKK